jgi:RNA polymerase sigma factor, sigma-70 family
LNHQEIENCVRRAKLGNTEDLEKLLDQYKPFIIKTAKGFNIKNHDLDDFLQIGYIAIINSLKKYRLDSNTFSSYAYNSIKNAFRYVARENSKAGTELSLNVPINAEIDKYTEFIDCLDSEEDIEEKILRVDGINGVKKVINKLSDEEMKLVSMLYYNNSTLKAYAAENGISYIRAIRRKKRLLKKLRERVWF